MNGDGYATIRFGDFEVEAFSFWVMGDSRDMCGIMWT